MTAKFIYQEPLWLELKPAFFVLGRIAEGIISEGMVLEISMNASLSMEIPIVALELVDGDSEEEPLMALSLDVESRDSAELISDLLAPGEVLDVINPTDEDLA